MADSELKFFPVFNTRPTPEYLDGFRKHIGDTGSPETYVNISTTKPPRDGPVILLSDDIRVPTGRRSDGRRVPCPLCSPRSPKFGTGRIAWFPEEAAIRFIGKVCAQRFFGDDYSAAERLFRIEAACSHYIGLWPKLQAMLPKIDTVVYRLLGVGTKVEELRKFVDDQAPGFASFLHNDLVHRGSRILTSRDAGAKTYEVQGLQFLSLKFRPAGAVERMRAACRNIRLPLPEWKIGDGENASAKEIMRRGQFSVARLKEVADVRDLLDGVLTFFKPTNLRRLQQWHGAGFSPYTVLTFKLDGERVEALAESFSGRSNWSIVIPATLATQIPTREEIEALNISEVLQ